jgi:hypothetical protein
MYTKPHDVTYRNTNDLQSPLSSSGISQVSMLFHRISWVILSESPGEGRQFLAMPAPNGDKIKSSIGRMTGKPPSELEEKCAQEPIYQQQIPHGVL